MAKAVIVDVLIVLVLASTCNATNYVVGGTSGWDISTDLDSWAKGNTFLVGDTLLFQYTSSHSLDELTKENFDACNTTDVLSTYSNGNTTVPLTAPGPRYFVCGNRLHCLSGMKLAINVQQNTTTTTTTTNAPVGAPQAQPGPGATPQQPSSKSNNPTSAGFMLRGRNSFLAMVFLAFWSTLL